MVRGKKVNETNNKKKKQVEDEELEAEELEEEETKDSTKKNKKTIKQTKDKKKKADAEEKEDAEEDPLTDLDAEEIDETAETGESGENDEVVSSHKQERPPVKVIDPKTPIGTLKTDDILTYLIQVGADTLNPQLKFGALNLLQQLTGRRRRTHPPSYGSKRGGYPRGFVQRGGRGGGRGFMPRIQPPARGQTEQNDLYEDQ